LINYYSILIREIELIILLVICCHNFIDLIKRINFSSVVWVLNSSNSMWDWL